MPNKPWREIQAEHSKHTLAERESQRIAAIEKYELVQLSLAQIRKARAMTQATVAEIADVAQGEVSKIERRTDAYVGTVRRYVEALGGTLRLVADFPDGAPIEIMGFGESDAVDARTETVTSHG